MANQNNVLKVMGVTFNNADGTNRQTLIDELEVGDFVQLFEDINNPKDKKAIAFANDAGQILGYIGADDPMREIVRHAMKHDNFFATIVAIPGRYPEMKKQYSQGLRVAVGNVRKDGDCRENFAPLFKEGKRSGKHPANRYDLERKHKVDDFRRLIVTDNNTKRKRELKQAEHQRLRRKFKNGIELDAIDMGWKYHGCYTDEYIQYAMRKWHHVKTTDEELLQMERKLFKAM